MANRFKNNKRRDRKIENIRIQCRNNTRLKEIIQDWK